MQLRILTLNCGKGYVPGLETFLSRIMSGEAHDFILLQELDDRTAGSLKGQLGSYALLRTFNQEVNAWSQIAIAYRSGFSLESQAFFPFTAFKKQNLQRPEFGLLAASFRTPSGKALIGSLHMNANLSFGIRQKECHFVKESLLAANPERLPVIFGGDFNSGLVGEKPRNERIFMPQFVNGTRQSGPTVDSRYVEPVVPINVFAVKMARLGLGLRMHVDHIYMDQETARNTTQEVRVLPDRVSDHSPLELSLLPRSPAAVLGGAGIMTHKTS